MKYFFPSLLIATFAIFVFSPFAVSAGIVPCATTENNTPCTLCHLIVGFWKLIDYGFKILVFVALVCLVIAGVMYILSAGNEQMITTAKTFIKQVLYGFGFVLAAWLLIFVVMNYFAVKQPDLGIGKTEGWTKFTCSMESVTGTGTPSSTTENSRNYTCNQVDVDGNGTIESGEGSCNYVTSGGTMTYDECRTSCAVSSHDRCGAGDAGMCWETLGSCPATTHEISDTDNECSSEQKCCAPDNPI